MLFHPNTHPERQRSSLSTTALAHPSRRTAFVYASNTGYARGTLRHLLDGGLRTFLGEPDATMRYTPEASRKHVTFLDRSAKLLAWSPHIPFRNLSCAGAGSLPDTRELIGLMRRGVLRWEEATLDEIRAACLDVASALPGPLFPAPLPDVARRDVGSRLPHFDADGEVVAPRYERKVPKSAAWVGEEVEDSDAAGPAGWRRIAIVKDGFHCVLEGGLWSFTEVVDGEAEDPITEWES